MAACGRVPEDLVAEDAAADEGEQLLNVTAGRGAPASGDRAPRCGRWLRLGGASVAALVLFGGVAGIAKSALGGAGGGVNARSSPQDAADDAIELEEALPSPDSLLKPIDAPGGPESMEAGVLCFIDAYEALLRINLAALSIKGAVKVCEVQSTDNQMAECSAAVNLAMGQLLLVTSFITVAINDCSDTLQEWAACTSVVTGTAGCLEIVAGAASSMTQTCSGFGVHPKGWPQTPKTTTPLPMTRRKKAHEAHKKPVPPITKWLGEAVALDNSRNAEHERGLMCWITTTLAPTFLTRAGVVIADATKWCSAEAVADKKGEAQHKCAVDVIGIMSCFALVARVVSLAVPSCAEKALLDDPSMKQAACSADASGVAGALFAAVATGMQARAACSPPTADEDPVFFDFLGRRLTGKNAEGAMDIASMLRKYNESALLGEMKAKFGDRPAM